MQIFLHIYTHHSLNISLSFLSRVSLRISIKSLGFISCTILSAIKKLSAWIVSREFIKKLFRDEKNVEKFLLTFCVRKYWLIWINSNFDLCKIYFLTCKKFFSHYVADMIRFLISYVHTRYYMRVKIHACPSDLSAHLSRCVDCHSSNPSEQNYELMNISPPTIADDARHFASARPEIISREYFSGLPYIADFDLILIPSAKLRFHIIAFFFFNLIRFNKIIGRQWKSFQVCNLIRLNLIVSQWTN